MRSWLCLSTKKTRRGEKKQPGSKQRTAEEAALHGLVRTYSVLEQGFNQIHPPSHARRGGSLESNCGEAPQHREASHPDVAHSAGWIEDGTRAKVTDYLTSSEGKQLDLQEAGEMTSNAMFSAMVLKGLPPTFESIATVLNFGQRKSYEEMKQDLINFANTRVEPGTDVASTAFHSSGATAAGRSRASSAKKMVTWRGTAGQRKAGRASSAMRRGILQGIARTRSGSPVAPAGVQRSKASLAYEALKVLQRKEDSSYWWTRVATCS